MSSELTDSDKSPLTIHKIIERLSELDKNIAERLSELDNKLKTASTDAAETASANQQESSTIRDDGDESSRKAEDDANKEEDLCCNIFTPSNKKKANEDGVEKEEEEESNKRKEVLHELGKSCKELKYMISSMEKLQSFETELEDPLQTLHQNVGNILKDLDRVTEVYAPKQIPINLRVLRNNITRVKIQIPLLRHTAKANSANKPWQTTIATRDADDLPHIYNEKIFEESYFFEEIKAKYEKLKTREKLRLLCFAIFPENAEIKKRLLRFWWVGENLVPVEEETDEMEAVTKTLDTFEKNGFIKPVLKKNKLLARSYTMTPIVRSCLIKFAADKETAFFDYDSEGKPTMDFSYCKKSCMVKSEEPTVGWFADYLKNSGGERLTADLVKLQMLFKFPTKAKLKEASERFDLLQTLFNVSKQFPSLPKEWFSKMKNIKVLYLGRWETTAGRPRHIEVEDIDFLRGLKNMKKLRLLSLQGVSGIPRLPNALCKLSSLKILDLRACHALAKLPERIGELKSLTYLDLSECYLLDDLPQQIKKLEELQVLKGFVTGNGKNCCSFEDLAELKNLRKLSVNVNSTAFKVEKAGEDISKFQSLKKLRITWGSGVLAEYNPDGLQSADTLNPSEGERKTQGKEAAKAETQSKGAKPKSAAKKPDKGQEKVDDPRQIKGEQKLDDKKDEQKGITSLGAAARAVGFINILGQRKNSKSNPQGLERLEKLDLQCFPEKEPPSWLVPERLTGLKNLSLRGGRLGHLNGKNKWKLETLRDKWKVETLRLKYLTDFKMDWKDMHKQFPSLKYLEKVRCPRITFCPCDASGVWQKTSHLTN